MVSALQHSPREEFWLTQPEIFLGLPRGMLQSRIHRPGEGVGCSAQPRAWPREWEEGRGEEKKRQQVTNAAGNTLCPSLGCLSPLLLPALCYTGAWEWHSPGAGWGVRNPPAVQHQHTLAEPPPGGGRKAESLGSHTPVTATSGCLTKHRTDQKKNLSKGNENTAQVYDQQSYHLPYTGLLLGKRRHYFSEWEN